MKLQITGHPLNHQHAGYVSVLGVVILGLMLIGAISTSFQLSLHNQEVQKQQQIRIDYSQREHAMLRGLLREVPNKAIGAMMEGSASESGWQNRHRWRWIFEEALALANGETALAPEVAEVLGVATDAISGNTGDGTQGHIRSVVGPAGGSVEDTFSITPGLRGHGDRLGEGYPEVLVWDYHAAGHEDGDKPILTDEKRYADGALFKSIPYPKIHFGYGDQAETFVAKRNWWAFSVAFGRNSAGTTGVVPVTKDYILSIYEIPTQLPLGSTGFTQLGQHADGSNWADVTIGGGVFAESAITVGPFSARRLSTRRGALLGDESRIGGVSPDHFGNVPSRESYEAEHAGFFPISASSESGLVAFVPIHRGEDSFRLAPDSTDPDRLSPTGWEWYSRPAERCGIKIRLGLQLDGLGGIALEFRFSFKNTLGVDVSHEVSAGSLADFLAGRASLLGSTPTDLTGTTGALGGLLDGGVTLGDGSGETTVDFPLSFESTPSRVLGLTSDIGKLAAYIEHLGGSIADGNDSLYIDVDLATDLDEIVGLLPGLDLPDLPSNLPLIIRGSRNLTIFPKGFSLVTPLTVYVAEDLNIVPSLPGLGDTERFPPFSLFSPDVRFGFRDDAVDIKFGGQLNYIGSTEDGPINPLDLRSGRDLEVNPDRITANLTSISDPGQIPPVYQISWLVTIQEVHH